MESEVMCLEFGCVRYPVKGEHVCNRCKLEDQLMWSTGRGYGICAVGHAMLWSTQRPKRGEPDWLSVVSITLPKEKYTDEELMKLIEFSKERTAQADKLFSVRMGSNLIVIDKEEEGRWLRKRMSWYVGPMYSPTLEEALEFMGR